MSWRDTIRKGSWRDTIKKQEPEMTDTESFLRGTAQGASLGFADEIVGGAKALKDIALTDAELGDIKQVYIKNRDEYRQGDDLASELNPLSYGAGNVVGGATTMLIPGLNVAKGASVANAAIKGAIAGGLTGIGGSEAETPLGAVEDIVKGAAVGGALGGAGQKVANYLSSSPTKVADRVQDFAEKRAFKALDPSLNLQRKAEQMKRVNSIGRELLDNKIISPFDSVDNLIPKLKAAGLQKDEALQVVRDLVEESGARANLSTVMDDALLNQTDNLGMGRQAELISKAYVKEANNILQVPERGINDIVKLKGKLGEAANYNKLTGATPNNEAAKLAYNSVRDLEDDLVKQAAPNQLDDYLLNRELSSHYKQALESAEDAAARKARNRSFGLTDTIAAAGQVAADGGVTGVVKGLALGTANKFARERGNSMLAVGADRLSNIIRKDPLKFGKYSSTLTQAAARGGNSLAATHYLLSQQDPEYRKTAEEAFKDD